MTRERVKPRPDWRKRVEKLGLIFHTWNGTPYWDESVCYRFRSAEIDTLELATEQLQQLCIEAGQFIVDHDRFDDLAIPPQARDAIRAAWDSEPPSIYGRFDLAYDGVHPPKLLEYNANTPTGLLEAAVIQWNWREELFPHSDQFNSIHEKLIAKWSGLKNCLRSDTVHFTSMANDEDLMTATYLRDTAQQAGIKTKHLFVRDIGYRRRDRTFRDLEEERIGTMFSLYPWEWLLADSGREIVPSIDGMDWMEPIWKMLWSNKALLAILWEISPGHPNLLPAFLDGPRDMAAYVRKPLLSREGANILVHSANGAVIETGGPYGNNPVVYQELAPGWNFDLPSPVLGSWYVTDQGPAGLGIRESIGITTNTSRFVPHYFD